MAYFPDVAPGEVFRPDAKLSNAVRRMVNARNRNSGIGQHPSLSFSIVVWNASNAEIEAFSAINFPEEASFSGEAVPAVPFYDESIPWGIALGTIPPGEIGNCAVSGPLAVECSGSGKRAKPSAASPRIFALGADGARVLYAHGSRCVINLGENSGFSWNGPFALRYDPETDTLRISDGYLRRNGDFIGVPEKEITPENGTLCVTSCLKDGEWTEPEIVFAVPDASHYPIGKCTLKDDGAVVLDSFHVAVAVILDTGPCPLIQMAGS